MDSYCATYPSPMGVTLEQDDDRLWAAHDCAFRCTPGFSAHPSFVHSSEPRLVEQQPSSFGLWEQNFDDMPVFIDPFRNGDSIDCSISQTLFADHRLSYPIATPSESGPASCYGSSRFSGSQSPPWQSPQMNSAAYSPPMCRDELSYCFAGYTQFDDGHYGGSGSCVAPHDVQHAADQTMDIPLVEDDRYYQAHMTYAQEAHEGYHPVQMEASSSYESVSPPAVKTFNKCFIKAENSPDSPNLRRRRPPITQSRSSTSTRPPRVAKRTGNGKPYSTTSRARVTIEFTDSTRPFVCPFAVYGCKSSFGSKNEWKRHVNTQHMRLGFWRCKQCEQPDKLPNDFNRKDLFIQHVRRMHPMAGTTATTAAKAKPCKTAARQNNNACKDELEERALADTANDCYRHLRNPPGYTGCLFCSDTFTVPQTWDDRMEHIGRHMEAMKKGDEALISPVAWQVDERMEEWLLQEQLIVEGRDGLVLAESRL